MSKAHDSEIEATSSIMSLKCPLSTLRIDVPCRSTVCTHNQCFDATSFLQLQEQAPTWSCPICNKNVAFDALEVDQYVDDILRSTSKSVEQVIIEPNGQWHRVSEGRTTPDTEKRNGPSDDDDDELVEIKDLPRVAAMKAAGGSATSLRTPPTSSREQSTSSAVPPSTSAKRPIGQVVDLTLSSDDEDQPPRAPKRQAPQTSTLVVPRFSEPYSTSPRTNGEAQAYSNQASSESSYPSTSSYGSQGYPN